jgi:hypothetical protein
MRLENAGYSSAAAAVCVIRFVHFLFVHTPFESILFYKTIYTVSSMRNGMGSLTGKLVPPAG